MQYEVVIIGNDGFVWNHVVDASNIVKAVEQAEYICSQLTIERTIRVSAELVSV